MTFRRFVGLSLGECVPDAKTIWLFKDTPRKQGIIDSLFDQFTVQSEGEGVIGHTGTGVDATFVDAPRQRNSRDENIRINKGETPEEWIEHVFGFMTGSMHGLTVRSIGIRRAEFNIGLANLVYNICRYAILKRKRLCIG